MSDTKTPGEKKLTLSLKPRTETGVVRQSFSHGRSKVVQVERKRKRLFETGADGKVQEVKAPAAGIKARAAEMLAKETAALQHGTLTEDEKAHRLKALQDAMKADEESRLRAEEDAKREAEEDAQRAAEEKLRPKEVAPEPAAEAPRERTSSCLAGLAAPTTSAPARTASWTSSVPTPPAAARASTRSPGRIAAASVSSVAVRPSATNATASSSARPSGTSNTSPPIACSAYPPLPFSEGGPFLAYGGGSEAAARRAGSTAAVARSAKCKRQQIRPPR